LKTQKANGLGFIPYLGYGRGYTSVALLEQDRRIIQNRMRDFGFRHSQVSVSPSVLLNGEDLIITFNVNEGPLTRVAAVEVRGNKILQRRRLRKELKTIVGGPLYRSQIRVDLDDFALYAKGPVTMTRTLVLQLSSCSKKGADEQVRLVYNVRAEGTRPINLIIANGVR
jgi:outer membrane protein assembly factor BamA